MPRDGLEDQRLRYVQVDADAFRCTGTGGIEHAFGHIGVVDGIAVVVRRAQLVAQGADAEPSVQHAAPRQLASDSDAAQLERRLVDAVDRPRAFPVLGREDSGAYRTELRCRL